MGAPLNYQTPPPKRRPQETAALAAIIALIHFLATFLTLIVGFPLAQSANFGHTLLFVHGILRIPLGFVHAPGLAGWIALLSNSIIWGVVIAYSVRLVRRHLRRA